MLNLLALGFYFLAYRRLCPVYVYVSYEVFTRRELTKLSDRAVAFRGVEEHLARAVSSEAHHGIISEYLHRMLLWQRSQGATTEPINWSCEPRKI